MSDQLLSLSDRFTRVLLMRERAQEAIDKLAKRPSGDPRFTMSMLVNAQTNALIAAFGAAWETLNYIRQVAESLPQNKDQTP